MDEFKSGYIRVTMDNISYKNVCDYYYLNYIKVMDYYENLVNLIRINKDDFPYIEIIIDKYNLVIPIKELNFKKYQTYNNWSGITPKIKNEKISKD